MNSKAKGSRGERELAKKLREYGYECRRGQQYCGANGDADVIGLRHIHIECKRVEKLNVEKAMEQAQADSKEGEYPTVMHRKDGKKWLVTMFLDDWIKIYTEAESDIRIKEMGLLDMKVKLDENAIMPTKAHKTDAGFDIYSTEDKVVKAKQSAIFDTGVHIELPMNTVGMLKSKSGLNVKHSITSEGVIDEGYTGSITVKLYNNGDTDYTVKKGDKITQLVILPLVDVGKLELVEDLTATDRGNNGFGSSGR